MKKYFVILGGNMLLKGIYDKLKSFGYEVIVIDWNDEPAVKGDIHIQVDVKDANTIIKILKKGGYDIDGAISCIDLAVPSVNAINKAYGLLSMPEKFNTVLTKSQMRTDWEVAGIFNRFSKSFDDTLMNEIIALNYSSKVIIKPDIAASSRGITILEKNSAKGQIENAIKKAKDISFDNNCLVEEFIEGQEFTIDMLGDNYGNICVYGISVKYHSKNAINNRVAVKPHWNSNAFSDDVYRKIAERGKECYRAIGLKNAFGHLEMIMKPDGTFSPVEIGARSSGFIASHLVAAASGRDYLNDYIKMLHGENVGSKDHINGRNSSMWFGYDIPSGLTSIKESNLVNFLSKEIKVMYSNRDGLQVGKTFGSIIDDNGRDHAGYEMLTGPKDILTIDNIRKAEQDFLNDFSGKNES